MAYTTIDNPSEYFKTVLYTGDSTEPRNIDVGFQSDIVWAKDRTVGYHHRFFDSSRGNVGAWYPNDTKREDYYNDGPEVDFSSPYTNGWKIIDNPDGSTGSVGVNQNTHSMCNWNWLVNGGTTSTNTDGDINSTVQVNADAGISIVTWSATNTTARSIGHGLGIKPMITIVRNRTREENARVHASSFSATGASVLDNNSLHNTATTTFTADSTSSVFKVGTDFSVNGNYPYVAYCFAPIKGYSKFGHIKGNSSTATDGTADDTFVYCGFRPAMVIYKQATDGVANWEMIDTARDTYNPCNDRLFPSDTTVSNTTEYPIDILSTGFKMRDNYNGIGSNGTDYIYMAWAEHPFVTSTGVPTTAR